jgi:membrane-bound metal-dependent hydrolase YbcI (DUF457 family)
MDGSTHAATGFLAGAGIGLFALHSGLPHGLMYGAVTAGLALLPDSDHPQASFANAAGTLSHGISHIVAVLFGGHRYGMHSLFGIALAATATQACAVWWPNHWALGSLAAVLAICVAAGLNATGFARYGLSGLLWGSVLAGLAVYLIRPELWWLVILGMGLHIIEDEFSGHGCAIFWPISRRRFGGDGKQPAGARSRSAPARRSGSTRPRTGTPRKSPARRPSDTRPAARGPQSMCLSCWVEDCEACKGQGCKCPQPLSSHPRRRSARAVAAVPDPEPGIGLDDTPPF